jgi:hypothetical protein
MQLLAWNAPELPVIPWTRSLVLLSTNMAICDGRLTRVSFMDADGVPIRAAEAYGGARMTVNPEVTGER